MKVCWVTFAQISVDSATGKLTSPLASARYRSILPAYELAKHGTESAFCYIDESTDVSSLENVFDSDVIIFNKSFCKKNEVLAAKAKLKGIKVVLDLSDNYFTDAEFSQHYLNMVALADTVVVPTEAMAAIVTRYTGEKAIVIADPYEGAQQAAKFCPQNGKIKLLWFGHSRGLESISNEINNLIALSQECPLELTLMTSFVPGMFEQIDEFNSHYDRHFKLRFIPWSLTALWQALSLTDLVIIPSKDTQEMNVKSNNRMIESLWAGRYVIANPVPSYAEFSDQVWLSNDIEQGIRWAINHPASVIEHIEQAQSRIEKQYSPETVGLKWQSLIENVNANITPDVAVPVFETEVE